MFALIRALLHYRLGQEQVTREDVLSNWEAILNFMVKQLGHEKIERIVVVINSQNEVIADEIMSSGTVDRTAIFPREITKQALHHRATAVTLA